jgi:hypothetical protein
MSSEEIPSWLQEERGAAAAPPAASGNPKAEKKNWRTLFKNRDQNTTTNAASAPPQEPPRPSAPPAYDEDMGLEPSGIKLNMSLSTDPSWVTGRQESPKQRQNNIANLPDDGATPAWALRPVFTPPAAVAANEASVNAPSHPDIEGGQPRGEGPKRLDLDAETIKKLQFYQTVLKVLYTIAAALLGAAAGLSLVGQTDIGAAFFAIYILIFCLLMCCFEVGFNVSICVVFPS